MNVLCDRLWKGVTGKCFGVAVSSRVDTVSLIMLLETTKTGITDTIKVNEHFFADGDGLKLVGTPGTSASFSSNAVVAAEGLNVR